MHAKGAAFVLLALAHSAAPVDAACRGWNIPSDTRILADINADGMADLVVFGDRGVWTGLATGDGNFTAPDLVLDNYGANQGWRRDKHVRALADINGDRKADIVGFGNNGVWTSLATENGRFAPPAFVVDNYGTEHGWTPEKHVRVMADISGDGLADIVGFGTEGVWTSLARGDGHFISPVFVVDNYGTEHGWRPDKHVRVMADISGDGLADIVGFGQAGVWTSLARGDGHFISPVFGVANYGADQGWTPAKHVRALADIDGDRKADIVGFGKERVWTSRSIGDGRFTVTAPAVPNFATDQGWTPEKHVRLLADINGDGNADIVGFGAAGVWTALSNGNGRFAPAQLVIANYGSDQGWTLAYQRTVAGISTDGKDDLLAFGADGLWTALATTGGGFAAARIACAGGFDFNLDWTDEDPNRLPLNPRWTWQKENPGAPSPPSAGLCHYFSKAVRVPQPNGGSTIVKVPDFADCTDQTGPDRVDTPDGWNAIWCGLASSRGFYGHLNWFPATFTGAVSWGDHNGWDDDYYMPLTTVGAPAVLSEPGEPPRHELHTEFDTDETLDHFDAPWWNEFEQAENDGDTLYVRHFLRKHAGGDPFTIMTGLFGVDCEHDGCKSELHPVYTMAARVRRDVSTEMWAMFLRNWGNEGYCSRLNWPVDFTRYTFRLPWRPGAQSVEVLWGLGQTVFNGTEGTAGPEVDFTPGRGIDVTFTLGPPSQKPLIEGELHLRWLGTPLPPPAGVTTPLDEEEDHEPIEQALDRLTPAQREQVANAAVPVPSAVGPLRPFPAGVAARPVPSLGAPPAAAVRLGTPEPALRKLARDEARLRELCRLSGGSLPGLPREACPGTTPSPSPGDCARERARVESAQAELQALRDERRNLEEELSREESPAVKKRIMKLIAELNTQKIPAATRALAAAEAALRACTGG
jgi:VCBS repeat protein